MIATDFVKSEVPNSVIIMRFHNYPDVGMTFSVDVDEKTNKVSGISLYYVNKKTGETTRTKTDVISLFSPSFKCGTYKDSYILSVKPMDSPIIIKRRQNGTFSSRTSFNLEGKIGVITSVDIDVKKKPITYDINGTFRKSKEGPVKTLTDSLTAPMEFTNQLHDFFKNQ